MEDSVARPAPPQTIYHYTSQQGLLGIIQQRALWVSSIRHLNDAAESQFAIEIMKEQLKPSPEDDPNIWTPFFDQVSNYFDVMKDADSLVGSFSEEGDQLGQWRAYTGGGVGFSIGFDFRGIRDLADAQMFSIQQCAYTPEEHNKIIAGLISATRQALRKRDVEHADLICTGGLLLLAPRLKHPSFAEEKEWRIVTPVTKAIALKFTIGKSMIIPYGEFKFANDDGKMPIVEIVVGPAPHMQLSVESVERLLSASGLGHVSVRPSSVPFRNW